MPDTTLSRPASVKLNGKEFQHLVLLIDEASRLHVAGLNDLCRAAYEGTESVLTAMIELGTRVGEARARERRRHVANKTLR